MTAGGGLAAQMASVNGAGSSGGRGRLTVHSATVSGFTGWLRLAARQQRVQSLPGCL
jgi:hypothetical protein